MPTTYPKKRKSFSSGDPSVTYHVQFESGVKNLMWTIGSSTFLANRAAAETAAAQREAVPFDHLSSEEIFTATGLHLTDFGRDAKAGDGATQCKPARLVSGFACFYDVSQSSIRSHTICSKRVVGLSQRYLLICSSNLVQVRQVPRCGRLESCRKRQHLEYKKRR